MSSFSVVPRSFEPMTFRGRFLLGFSVLLMGFLFAVPSTFAAFFTVNTTSDLDDAVCDGTHCSLREAINAANAAGGIDGINFSVTGTIALFSSLPTLTEQVDIDGNNAGVIVDSKGNTVLNMGGSSSTVRGMTFHNSAGVTPASFLILSGTSGTVGGDDATDRMVFTNNGPAAGRFIEVTGSNYTVNNVYLGLTADGSTVKGNQIGILFASTASGTNVFKKSTVVGNTDAGIQIAPLSGTLTITGNNIGVKPDGSTAANGNGINDQPGSISANVTIGGAAGGDKNVISGNTADGINLVGSYTSALDIQGNNIGTNSAGANAVANGSDGVELGGTCTTLGNCLVRKNVISGNTVNGVNITGGAVRWQLLDNLIGTNFSGNSAIANSIGVKINGGATSIYIGRSDNSNLNFNVISGNTNQGVYITNATGSVKVSSNYIGTTISGASALANGGVGIDVELGSVTVDIGDCTATSITNVISGNAGAGITFRSNYSGTGRVCSSIIGLTQNQGADLGNGSDGIDMTNGGGATGTVLIGSTRTTGFNVIAGNVGSGINSNGGANDVYAGNFIGLNSSEANNFKNDKFGILVASGSAVTGPKIGGTNAGEGNVIVAHTTSGPDNNEQIRITSVNVSGTKIFGNFIGVSSALVTKGGSKGIWDQGTNTEIGSSVGTGSNTIGGLAGFALALRGTGTIVFNNYMGISSGGGNISNGTQQGVFIENAAFNITFGGMNAGEPNFISNMVGSDGLNINDASNISIIGNYIGVDLSGNSDQGNAGDGIEIQNATDIYIGRNADASVYKGNVISGNTGHGIFLTGASAITNVNIQSNIIGLNAARANKIQNDMDGINVAKGTGVIIGGITANDSNTVSGNANEGIEVTGVNGVIIKRNYIGTTPNGTNVSTVGNTLGGIRLQNGASNNVVGNAFGDTLTSTLDSGNYLGYNGVADVILDGGTTNFNSLRGNRFNFGASDTSVNISLANNANNGANSATATVVTKDTSRVAATTSLVVGSKVDVYSINSTSVTTYEGTVLVQSDGSFQLDKDFTAVVGDNYMIQSTEPDSDSSKLTNSNNNTVDADNTAPGNPVVTSVTLTNSASYTFTGTKEAYTEVWFEDIPDAGGVTWVATDASTSWTYGTTLTGGVNEFSTLYAVDYSGNGSSGLDFSVTLDTVLPAAPTITSATAVSGASSTFVHTIYGAKEGGASVRLNGVEIVAANNSTTFGYEVILVPGAQTYLDFGQVDAAGNVGVLFTDHTVTYTQLAASSNPGGGGGGGGSGGSSTSTTPAEEDEVPPVSPGDPEEEEPVVDPEEETPNAGESEEPSEEEGVSSGGEEDISEDDIEVSGEGGLEEGTPSEDEGSSEEPSSTESGEVDEEQQGSTIVEDVEELYPVSDEEIVPEVADEPYVRPFPVRGPQSPLPPLSEVTREKLALNPLYIHVGQDRNDNGVPDWWEKRHFHDVKPSLKTDTDKDGVSDETEFLNNTDPTNDDSDSDGLSDGDEATYSTDSGTWDTDQDGLSDLQEIGLGIDPSNPDTDGDGFYDNVELQWGGDPYTSVNVPQSNLIGGGVPDAWLEQYGLDEIAYGEDVVIPGTTIEVERTLAWDTDLDGLSDADELTFGTNPLDGDSDGDGANDGAEVHFYQTNPMLLTQTGEFFKLRLANLLSRFKNTYVDGRPVLMGTATPNSTVEWMFIPLESEQESISLLKRSLFADLFEVSSGGVVSDEVTADAGGKFLIRPDESIESGSYALVLRSLDENGEVTEETLPYELKIDPELAIEMVNPRQLDEFPIDVTNLELIHLENSQPYLYGLSKPGYEVVAAWQSELYSSSLLVDTTEGEFVTTSPNVLEDGSHDLFVYAVDPVQNLYSSVINVDFDVAAGQLYSSATASGSYERLLLALAGAALLVSGFVYGAHRRRKRGEDAALTGLDPRL